jgi:hypothetical protein
MLRIPHCLDIRFIDGGKAVSPTHQPRTLLPRNITILMYYILVLLNVQSLEVDNRSETHVDVHMERSIKLFYPNVN